MTEIVTESFCERCGTRYTFEPVDTNRPLSSLGTFGRGLRHFFTDTGSTLGESFAVARSETEQRATTHALEAFHQTFNFCLSCRQYVCGECWNAVEGRCLSCAPVEVAAAAVAEAVLVVDAPTAPAPAAPDVAPPIEVVGGEVIGAAPAAMPVEPAHAPEAGPAPAAPTEEGDDAARSLEAVLGPLPEAPTEPLPEAPTEPLPEAPAEPAAADEIEIAAAEAIGEPEPELAAEPAADHAVESAAVDATLRDLQPGRSLDAEIAAYEELRAAASRTEAEPAVETTAAPEPEVVAEVVAEAPSAPEPEPEVVAEAAAAAAAAPEPEPEVVAEAAPAPEPEPEVVAEAPDVVDAWPGPEPVAPTPWRAAPPIGDERIAAVARPEATTDEREAMRSPLEFLPPILGPREATTVARPHAPVALGARSCPSCGLSISSNARFCRRCGTPQQQAG